MERDEIQDISDQFADESEGLVEVVIHNLTTTVLISMIGFERTFEETMVSFTF